jgi:hypothetical protein
VKAPPARLTPAEEGACAGVARTRRLQMIAQ